VENRRPSRAARRSPSARCVGRYSGVTIVTPHGLAGWR